MESSKQIQSIAAHKDIVTCLALGSDSRTLVTGSRDTTLMVWEIVTKGNNCKVEEVRRRYVTLSVRCDCVMLLLLIFRLSNFEFEC